MRISRWWGPVGVALLTQLLSLAAAGRQQPKKYPWEKEPGPIAGRWKVTCARSAGMIVEVGLQSKTTASGHVAVLGAAEKYGYSAGEEMLRLEADDLGKWVGQLKWRSVAGVQRWDPITMIATAEKLNAIMTTDDCYKDMPRVR